MTSPDLARTVGRRKEAVVRVRLVPGTGQYKLNGRTLENYFPNKVHQQAINEPFVLLEKSAGIGGTWNLNRYPGCECDVQSAMYSFSFEFKRLAYEAVKQGRIYEAEMRIRRRRRGTPPMDAVPAICARSAVKSRCCRPLTAAACSSVVRPRSSTC